MPTRLIINENDGNVTLSLQLPHLIAGDTLCAPFQFESPLSKEELEDLRWYLETYLTAPYAVWEERGKSMEGDISRIGEKLFSSLFSTADRRAVLERMKAAATSQEIWIHSTNSNFLSLPWELLKEPKQPFLCLNGIPISRTISVKEKTAEPRRGDSLNILMIISRPSGKKDVPYQIVARPLMERTQLLSGKVVIELLRPPTLDTLKRKLKDSKNLYDALHFDGHGNFGGNGSLLQNGTDRTRFRSQGFLAFEKEGGGRDSISAEEFGLLLRKYQIPLVVFNACRSGMVDDDSGAEATIATRLLQSGVAAVVAMSYSVYAVAAAEFMTVFYENLVRGTDVSVAVAEGRLQLHSRKLRPSPKGDMPLSDWMVPVHYGRRETVFSGLLRDRIQEKTSIAQTLRDYSNKGKETGNNSSDPLQTEGEFIGRDNQFYELEQAMRKERVAVIHGTGGTGKTELVRAFARWVRDSGGLDREELVFWDSFEPGLASFSLDGMIASLGFKVGGPDFVRRFPEAEQRREAILTVFHQHRLLWIWDNFETVHSMPDPNLATPPLQGEQLKEIREFIKRLAGRARGGLLITSRSSEPWLGDSVTVHRLPLSGLLPQDAALYAEKILAKVSHTAEKREERAYGELLEFMEGHPLSLRLVLPHLKNNTAKEILTGLKGQGRLPEGFEGGEGRQESLGACVSYSFQHLSSEMQQRLPILCYFEGIVNANILTLLSVEDNLPAQYTGVTSDQWQETLNRCAETGLLTSIGGGLFRIHPALPAFLISYWRSRSGEKFPSERRRIQPAMIKAYGQWGDWLSRQISSGDAALAMNLIDFERRTMGRVATNALEEKLFAETQFILQPLNDYWDSRGLYSEAKEWVDRIRPQLEDKQGKTPDLESEAGALWLFLVGSQANRSRRVGLLDRSEATYEKIRTMLKTSPQSSRVKKRLATVYHQLGTVAQDRGNLKEAASWYRNSLEIKESLDNKPGMAASYHQLGRVEQDRGNLEKAAYWYRKSLEIDEALGDKPGMAHSYHQLGRVEQDRGNLEKAAYWYRNSLEIFESLGNRPEMAGSYHQLGMVEQLRGNLDQAASWYRKSLEIRESLGNRPEVSITYAQLGLLAEKRENRQEALDWNIRAVSLFDDFPHHATGTAPARLFALSAELGGMEALSSGWQRVTGNPLPQKIRKMFTES